MLQRRRPFKSPSLNGRRSYHQVTNFPPSIQRHHAPDRDKTTDVKPTEQFRIIRQKGTEAPHSGAYESHASSGTYACAACSTPLYKSTTKFDSGCGWPAFYEGLPGAINRSEDRSLGSVRTEITCAACGGHLGHVFKGEGFGTPTDERHCVNSVSLKFADE